MLVRFARNPILLRVGVLLSIVVLLAMVSMLSSVFIAKTTEGLASAVNQSGSLRMQSYRVGMALADRSVPAERRARLVERLASEFESRLASPRLADAVPVRTSSDVRVAYQRVWEQWHEHMRPALNRQLARLNGAATVAEATPAAYLTDVDAFVAEVDDLVWRLERVAEGRIEALRRIQAISLLLTVAIVSITLFLVARRVIVPLGELLTCADRARRGDFGWRTRFSGDDELGRLGSAMNLMAEDLSRLYGGMEQRVVEKTRDLERSNHSLDLLYRVGTRLNESNVSEPELKRVLEDIQLKLGTGPVTLCLQDDPQKTRGRHAVTTRTAGQQRGACSTAGCLACRDKTSGNGFELPLVQGARRRVVSFPVEERGERFGVLIIDLDGSGQPPLQPWQQRLLASLAGQLGSALKINQRQREGRRLVLLEERGILARELHDSLAQSLSYLKIQAARLAAALDAENGDQARRVLGELREGINSAYRQLRELLTTFRLKMDDRGLHGALEATVEEFRRRTATEISLDNQMPASILSPNEEIHVLQIVREALSNVARHSGAAHSWVRLIHTPGGVEVEIADDGCGVEGSGRRAGHYGVSIMRERALTLDGTLSIESRPGGGTRVRLGFRHRASRELDAPTLRATATT